MFQITFAVEGFQRVTGIELPGAKKRLEAKAAGMGVLEQAKDEGAVVTREDGVIVIPFPNQRLQTFMLAGKRHGMRADVGGKEGVDRLLVLVELNMACFIIKIQHRV